MIQSTMRQLFDAHGKKDGWSVKVWDRNCSIMQECWTAGNRKDAKQVERECRRDLINRMIDES